MKEQSFLYEYAVIRFVPDIEREEFFNIGLLMMSKRAKWIRLDYNIDINKIKTLSGSDMCADYLEDQLMQFKRVAEGVAEAGPMASISVEERFRWLSAVKSACIQTSRPHPGVTSDLEQTFNCIMQKMVL